MELWVCTKEFDLIIQEGVKNTRKCITMVEYIVEDRQGRRHATLAPAPLRAQ